MSWGKFWNVLFLLFAAALLLVTGLSAWLASDRIERVTQIYDEATIYETAVGAQQAIVRGEGPPLLVLHGALGGCDLGMWLARHVGVDETMEVIAPSRPGYLGTPLDGRVSAEAQADALAALLDTLERDKVAIITENLATDVALVFAEKFPNRVNKFVIINVFFTPQETFWANMSARAYRQLKLGDMGWQLIAKVNPDIVPDFPTSRRFPHDLRMEGSVADAKRVAQMSSFQTPDIPILLLSRKKTWEDAKAFVAKHPNATLLEFAEKDDGLSSPDTIKAIREFLSGSAEISEQP